MHWRRTELVAVGSLLLATGALGLLWLYSIPFQHGPDEGAHYQVVRFIRDSGRLPRFSPDELWLIRTPSGVVETYATFPPLAYLTAALATFVAPNTPLWAARFVSFLSYLGTVGLTYALGRLLFPSAGSLAITAALMVGLLPQFVFTGAYVNNDAMAVFSTTLLLVLVARFHRSPANPWLGLVVGVAAGAVLLTKYSFYAAAAVGLGTAVWLALRQRGWSALAALLVGTAVTSVWWFVRNQTLYGEVIPGRVVAEAKAAAGGNTLFIPINQGIDLISLSTRTDFWFTTLRSFVGSFGFLSIYLDPTLYAIYAAVAALGLAGFVLWLIRHRKAPTGWLAVLPGIGIVCGTILSAMAINVYGEWSPQGRYLFAMLPVLGLGLALGWHTLGGLHRTMAWLPGAVVLVLTALNLWCLVAYVVPRDFSSAEERVAIEIDRPSAPQAASSPIEILGWSIAQGSDYWRPFDPRVVDEYRRPVSGIMIYLDGPPGDGTFQSVAQYGFRRLDVSEFYGSNRRLDRIGFRYVFPPGTFSPGDQTFFACAVVETSLATTCTRRTIQVTD